MNYPNYEMKCISLLEYSKQEMGEKINCFVASKGLHNTVTRFFNPKDLQVSPHLRETRDPGEGGSNRANGLRERGISVGLRQLHIGLSFSFGIF